MAPETFIKTAPFFNPKSRSHKSSRKHPLDLSNFACPLKKSVEQKMCVFFEFKKKSKKKTRTYKKTTLAVFFLAGIFVFVRKIFSAEMDS